MTSFGADSVQTLNSNAKKFQQRPANNLAQKSVNKSFSKTISSELDAELENQKPNMMPISELEEDKYDQEKADKKVREVAFVTDVLLKDIDYTL